MLTTFGPVKGDFEVVEAGIAFSIFAFLPICQLHGGHATVDIFTNLMPKRPTVSSSPSGKSFWRWC
jgi:hypothetical protein